MQVQAAVRHKQAGGVAEPESALPACRLNWCRRISGGAGPFGPAAVDQER